jgi:hypothetical protein
MENPGMLHGKVLVRNSLDFPWEHIIRKFHLKSRMCFPQWKKERISSWKAFWFKLNTRVCLVKASFVNSLTENLLFL